MITKIQVDKEKAKSLLEMAENTEKTLKEILKNISSKESSNLITREYYEIIRELSTAILIIDGLKATGENAHKETIDNLNNHDFFSEEDIYEIQDLRIRINKNSYEGKPIESTYIENKRQKLDNIIKKSKQFLKERLK
jgi:hypothetical protein